METQKKLELEAELGRALIMAGRYQKELNGINERMVQIQGELKRGNSTANPEDPPADPKT